MKTTKLFFLTLVAVLLINCESNKEDEGISTNSFIGTWKAVSFNDNIKVGQFELSEYIPKCDVYTHQYSLKSATASITENKVTIVLSEVSSSSSMSSSGPNDVDCESINISLENNNISLHSDYNDNSNTTLNLSTTISNETISYTLKLNSNNQLILNINDFTVLFQKD